MQQHANPNQTKFQHGEESWEHNSTLCLGAIGNCFSWERETVYFFFKSIEPSKSTMFQWKNTYSQMLEKHKLVLKGCCFRYKVWNKYNQNTLFKTLIELIKFLIHHMKFTKEKHTLSALGQKILMLRDEYFQDTKKQQI